MMVDKQPFFVYATESRTVTTNQTVTDSLTIQSGSRGFLFERLTAQYDRDDWTVQINLSGLSRNLFDIKLRGALLFGLSAQPAAANVWPGGVEIDPAMYIPPNTTIVIETTNGPSGTLNIAYSLQGRDLLG